MSEVPDNHREGEGRESESRAWLDGQLDERTLDEVLARGSRVWLDLGSAASAKAALEHLGSLSSNDLRAAILTRLALSATLSPAQLESWWRELRASDTR